PQELQLELFFAEFSRNYGHGEGVFHGSDLDEVEGPEVVEVEDAFGLAAGCGDDERCDLLLFHEGEGGGGEVAGVDGEGVGVHDLGGGVVEGAVAVALEETAEVAVGDHAEEFAGFEDG